MLHRIEEGRGNHQIVKDFHFLKQAPSLSLSLCLQQNPPSLKIQSACASRLPSVPISLQPPNSSIASSLSLSSLCFLVYSGHQNMLTKARSSGDWIESSGVCVFMLIFICPSIGVYESICACLCALYHFLYYHKWNICWSDHRGEGQVHKHE